MRILMITGNPKKKGALATLTEEAVRGAKEGGAEVEEIRLADKNIGYCKFCLKCHEDIDSTISRCSQEDDMAEILNKVKDADGFMLVCPTSGGHPNSLMKTFIERTTWTLGRPTRSILWVKGCPESRIADKQRIAVLFTTAGVVPTWMRLFCNGSTREMCSHARGIFNAKVVGKLYGGGIFKYGLLERDKKRARAIGQKLAKKIALKTG